MAGVIVTRLLEYPLGRAGFDDPAVLHDGDGVGDPADHRQVMGDEQQPHAELPLDVADQVEDLGLDGDVEGGGRFIGDQQGRPAGQGHGDHHPLPLAAGELMGIDPQAGLGIVDAGALQQPHRLLFRLFSVHPPVQQQWFEELAADGVDRVERGHRFLEDHRDAIAAHGPDLVAVKGQQVATFEQDAAPRFGPVAFLEQAEDRQGGDRLAGTRFPDQGAGRPAVKGK